MGKKQFEKRLWIVFTVFFNSVKLASNIGVRTPRKGHKNECDLLILQCWPSKIQLRSSVIVKDGLKTAGCGT